MYQELYRSIDNGDVGSIEGYVSDNLHLLEKDCLAFYDEEDINLDKYKESIFGVIDTLNIEETFRGSGHGTKLMENIISDMDHMNVDYIFLVADGAEDNEFDIVEWYKNKFGFTPLNEKFNCTLMVKTNR